MPNIKIENFCEEQNKEFALYYSYLNNYLEGIHI